MKKLIIGLSYVLLSCGATHAQQPTTPAVLDNGTVKRVIEFPSGTGVSSRSYRLTNSGTEFLAKGSGEFSLTANGTTYTGIAGWKNIRTQKCTGPNDGSGLKITLDNAEKPFSVELIYLTYPELPVVHKALRIINRGTSELCIENLDIEKLRLSWNCTDSWVYRQFARHKWLGPYVGDWNDPLMVVHSTWFSKGLAVGNEAMGVIKRSSAFSDARDEVTTGLTHVGQDFAWRKWIAAGDSWQSPWVFTVPYEGTQDPYLVVNTSVSDFVRRHMGVRIEKLARKPRFVYNTWHPFKFDINEKLVRELAAAAAECGVEEFVIDDGWQLNIDPYEGKYQLYGDWEVDKNKFPGGLKPVFDYIKSLGMKPGLWLSIGSADPSAKVYNEHPEYFTRDRKGNYSNLHDDRDKHLMRSACLGTDWVDYIRDVILRLVRDHGLAYVKLDFAIVTSAYIFNNERTGCYATDHPYHKDRNESFGVIYDRCLQLYDELHEAAPELFIDCTFETAGKLQLIDYGIVKHAEGDWLSNVTNPGAFGAMRARSLAWERTPAIPATSLVIGNLTMNDSCHMLAYKSLAGALPIMLGDPRKLTPAERSEFKAWSEWYALLEDRHNFLSFRQDIPQFGEPREGDWDGFCRINTETRSGGLVGVFRNNTVENSRIVSIPWLDGNARYVVREGLSNKVIATLTGRELKEKGFTVTLKKPYDGQLYEINRTK